MLSNQERDVRDIRLLPAAVLTIMSLTFLPGAVFSSEAIESRLEKLEQDVQYQKDRLAIYDNLKRYTRGMDRHDAELIRGAFWPEARINYGPTGVITLDEFLVWAIPSHVENYEQNQHHITGQAVEFDGNTAHVESYVIYFLLGGKRSNQDIVGSGRYIERYEKRNGEWRILVREYIDDVMFTAPPYKDLCPEPDGCVGKRDHSDLSYMRPLVPQEDRER